MLQSVRSPPAYRRSCLLSCSLKWKRLNPCPHPPPFPSLPHPRGQRGLRRVRGSVLAGRGSETVRRGSRSIARGSLLLCAVRGAGWKAWAGVVLLTGRGSDAAPLNQRRWHCSLDSGFSELASVSVMTGPSDEAPVWALGRPLTYIGDCT